jgi:hypothetical protein
MLWTLAYVACMVVPRILPMHADMARAVFDTWKEEAVANDDKGRRDRMALHMDALQREKTVEEGFLCVMCENHITAMALLTRNDKVHTLHWIETEHTHHSSGMLLLYSLTSDALELSYETLDDRWILAHTYLL